MDFLDFMHAMFALKEQFNDMTWTADNFASGSRVTVEIPVTPQMVEMLNDARQMFAPRTPMIR